MADKNFEIRKGITVANSVIVTLGSNVGIGNTSPAYKLHVEGDTYVQTSFTLSTIATINASGLFVGSGYKVNSTTVSISNTYGLLANGGLGSAGQVLTSNGTTIYWSTISTSIGGANTYVLINDSGGTGGTANLTFDKSTNILKIIGTFDDCSANTVQQTLTDGATVNWDTSLGRIATVTIAGNRTIAAPTNLKLGTYILHVIQDATGSRTLTWNAVFKWPASVAPTLSTTANKRDIFSFVSDGTNLYGTYITGY